MADMRFVENNRIVQEISETAAQVAAEVMEERKRLNKGVWVLGAPIVILLFIAKPDIGAVAAMALVFIWLFARACGGWRISGAEAGDPVLRHGAMGELAVLEELKALSNDYVVLNQVCVPDTRSSVGYREMDYVVIGPNGAHILEAKSYKGHLSGHEHDKEWQLLKVGRGGTPYTSSCRNPVTQTRVYIRLLSDALKARGERVWLNGLVVLARDNDLDAINVQSMGVVQLSELVDYLVRFQGQTVRDPKAVAAAIKRISDETKVRAAA